jgi:hypothetical protein
MFAHDRTSAHALIARATARAAHTMHASAAPLHEHTPVATPRTIDQYAGRSAAGTMTGA